MRDLLTTIVLVYLHSISSPKGHTKLAHGHALGTLLLQFQRLGMAQQSSKWSHLHHPISLFSRMENSSDVVQMEQ